MSKTINLETFVPYDSDFLDDGWGPFKVKVAANLVGEALIRAINREVGKTEASSFRYNGVTYEVT